MYARSDWRGSRARHRAACASLPCKGLLCCGEHGGLCSRRVVMLARSLPSSCQAPQGSRARARLSTWCAGGYMRRERVDGAAKSVRSEQPKRMPSQQPVGLRSGGYGRPIRRLSQCVGR
jgi:hypothetical protein